MTVPILSRAKDRVAWMLATAICAACAALPAQATVHSDVVTAGKYGQVTGPSLVAFPPHPSPIYVGKVIAVAGDVISIDGTLTANALNSFLVDGVRDTAQYVIKVRHDRTGDGNGSQGDWFRIASNTASTVTVVPNGIATTPASVGVGDIVQIEKLVTLKDVFGSGLATVKVNPDTDFDVSTPEGDTLYYLAFSGFGEAWVYHNPVPNATGLPEGWWDALGGVFGGDGSKVTLDPDQAIFNFNNAGAGYEVTLTGAIQCFSLSHYILGGFNGVATGFAAPTTISTAGLYIPPLPGATFKADTAFDATLSDVLYNVDGTAFDAALIYHNPVPNATGLTQNWWDALGGTEEPGFPLVNAKGYYIQNLGADYIWREPKP